MSLWRMAPFLNGVNGCRKTEWERKSPRVKNRGRVKIHLAPWQCTWSFV